MPVTHGTTIRLFDVHPKLGRHQILDARSMAHTITPQATIKLAAHDPAIPILDQEDLHEQGIDVRQLFPKVRGLDDADALGSCVGNASTYALSNLYAGELDKVGLSATDSVGNEKVAIQRYHRATEKDEQLFKEYPKSDCGSSGLGSCRAMKADKLIDDYRWATSLQGLATALQEHGVIGGFPWFNSWFDADRDGFVDAGTPEDWEASGLAGGHELYVARLEVWDDRHPERCVLAGPNSWKRTWGDGGWWRMKGSTYLAMRRYIDIKQPRRAA
jgi:hypothetical protein